MLFISLSIETFPGFWIVQYFPLYPHTGMDMDLAYVQSGAAIFNFI